VNINTHEFNSILKTFSITDPSSYNGTELNFKGIGRYKSDLHMESKHHDLLYEWKLPVLVFARDGCTTTCIMITPPALSPKGILH
jgi:hypothetical protein